jgi:hypothetical protein
MKKPAGRRASDGYAVGLAPTREKESPVSRKGKSMRDFCPGDDLEAGWATDDSASIGDFVESFRKPAAEAPFPQSNSSVSSTASAKKQRAGLVGGGPRRSSNSSRASRRVSSKQKESANLLEMPDWEHPAASDRSKPGLQGRGSSLCEMLSRKDEEESSEEEEETGYLKGVLGRAISNGSRGKHFNASRTAPQRNKTAGSADSLGSRKMAMELDMESDTDDDDDDESALGVQIFSGRDAGLDDDGSVGSASIENFKPPPSRQEMAHSLLRGFDRELRIEASKVREPRPQSDRPKSNDAIKRATPKPVVAEKTKLVAERPVPKVALPKVMEPPKPCTTYRPPETLEKLAGAPETANISINPIPHKRSRKVAPPSSRHSSLPDINTFFHSSFEFNEDFVAPRIPRGPPRLPTNHARSSATPGIAQLFNSSLDLEDLQLDGLDAVRQSKNYGDLDDDRSVDSSTSHSSLASVEHMTENEKTGLEEKMLRMAMERSLSRSCSILDDVTPFSAQKQTPLHHSKTSLTSTGELSTDPETAERLAELAFEKEMLEFAIQRSLNDSKMSEYTGTTGANTSDGSGSSGGSGIAQFHHREDSESCGGSKILQFHHRPELTQPRHSPSAAAMRSTKKAPLPARREGSYDRHRGDQSRGDQSRGDQSRGDQSRGDQSRGDQSRGDQSRGDQSRGDQSRGDQSRGQSRGDASYTYRGDGSAMSGGRRHAPRPRTSDPSTERRRTPVLPSRPERTQRARCNTREQI